jgi:lipoprotein-anchoring transpeptidase ErfK/SrfK
VLGGDRCSQPNRARRSVSNPKNPSAGCVHLAKDDAEAWFNDLEVGDEVQVH